MKTTKSKTTGSTKKTTGTSGVTKVKKAVAGKSEPTEDQIRLKAEEIYHQRIGSGEYGTAQDDWHKAEKILRGL
jgi:hypothetical protein